ncbi:helix-turn-helix transcriptional regulator [Pseudomonas nitroreducens]|uniref:helix-turn-helix transcriptional regulator n=1 Tax=Pseudomonas nitroreducens TaxID=46680 RepID=UPI00351CE58C
MHDTNALAVVLREVHTDIIKLAEAVQLLANALEAEGRRGNSTPRFLSEEQFAEFLGTTVAALRTRRFRKQIPKAVWVKEGRRTLYSVEAYERWVQEQMQHSLDYVTSQQQVVGKIKTLSRRGPGALPYPLLV